MTKTFCCPKVWVFVLIAMLVGICLSYTPQRIDSHETIPAGSTETYSLPEATQEGRQSDYNRLGRVGEYAGDFSESQTGPQPLPLLAYQDVTKTGQPCDNMTPYWYTLGYRPVKWGDPAIDNIQNNPRQYWYGPNLGETEIQWWPKTSSGQYRGECRPGFAVSKP